MHAALLLKTVRVASANGANSAAASDATDRRLNSLAQLERELGNFPTHVYEGDKIARSGSGMSGSGRTREHTDLQVRWWTRALQRRAKAVIDEVGILAPLVALPIAPPETWPGGGTSPAEVLAQFRADLEKRTAALRCAAWWNLMSS